MYDCDERNCRISKVNDIFEALCRNLSTNNEVAAASEKFSALNTNEARVSFADHLLKKYRLYPKLIRQDKNDGLSTRYRQEGNEAFKKKDDLTAWNLYTKSIAYATTSNGNCLGLAYANRSAVLYEKMMYTQCLEDIANAFRSNYPENLHEKLTQREYKARERLQNRRIIEYYEKIAVLPPDHPNNKIECANPCVETRHSTISGRRVVALKKIELGDVIAIEKPYARLLRKEHLRDHCYYCLELCYNMIPCDGCVYAMFCAQKCKDSAWTLYHRYECPVLATLYALNVTKLTQMALRIAIMAKKDYAQIDCYEPETNDIYRSERYQEIHFLAANTNQRKSSDLFPKATAAAVVRNVMTEGSDFHGQLDDPERDERIFDELIMRHLQTGPTNFHDISECVESDDGGFLATPDIGVGVYAFLSLFNHSCAPNVVRHCHGSEIIVRAIEAIPMGAELLDNYGYHYAVMKKTERRRELMRQYFFDCVCEACENDWPLYQNLPYKGKSLDNDVSRLQSLIEGDRKEAVAVLGRLLDIYAKTAADRYVRSPNKFVADLQESVKQCYAILGNRRPKF